MSTNEEESATIDADQLDSLIPRTKKELLVSKVIAEHERVVAEFSLFMEELATSREIDLAGFVAIVDAESHGPGEHDGFVLSESEVRFGGFNSAVTTKMGQAHRAQRSQISGNMPSLYFPCTPVALLEFVDATGGSFEVAPEFRECVETKQKAALLRSKNAALGAAAKKGNSPIQAAKIDIRAEWENWQSGGTIFRGAADFARTMVEKHHAITSFRTIERWAGEWRKNKRGA